MIRKSASGAVETEIHTINSIISADTKCYAIDHDEKNNIPLIPTNSIKKQTSEINIEQVPEQEEIEEQDISDQISESISLDEDIDLQNESEILNTEEEKSREIQAVEEIDTIEKLEDTNKIPKAEKLADTEELENLQNLSNDSTESKLVLDTSSNINIDVTNINDSIKEKNIEDSSMSIGETSSIIPSSNSSRRIKAVKEAQNLLASVKVAIDNIKTLAEYEEKEQWFDSVFKDMCTAEWDIARDEVSEIIYKLGKFLLDNDKIEKGKECFWEVYKNFPDTRWYKQVFEELIDIECPKDMVFIPQNPKYIDEIGQEYSLQPYFIDQYPVTNAQYLEFVQATGINPPKHWVGDIYPIGQANHPVVWINIQDAMEYATWAGKRLPTEIEWSNAAKGKENFLWPWGNEYESKHCNCREDNKSETTSIGSYFIGRTSSNIYDLAGNVWEWTNSWYDTKNRVLKGGSWFTLEEFTNNNYRNFDYPDTRKGIYGFRCCKSFGY